MNRDEELYAAALELTPEERAIFLQRACGDDAALRARVEGLLQANDEADAFFRLPDVDRPTVILPQQPGDRIGRYKLLQKIGEGGCGVVFMAEQEEPVRRRVALKVIKLGMDTASVIARFEAERQALAMMDHPNITRVLDAGATETGRPYFVMELVRGIPITRYCDEENLSPAQRLQLFIQVCHAIQHAHQKGIVHRDIKPTNILVTMHDDVAVPKVIDFGIAKATQGRLTDKTVFTAFEQFMGTPAYMSPEQAQFNDLDVDGRSDIYSLGVLLYELLTGRPPFDPKTLRQCGIDEIRRIIREVEPPRPSAQLSTLNENDRLTIAKQRGTAPAQLSTLMSGDLDWIVMRAMEKNRTRRYQTPDSLAHDLKRHLSHEPVEARPPSAVYRLQKFAARNKVALMASGAVAAALVFGLALSPLLGRKIADGRGASGSTAEVGLAGGVAIRKLTLANAGWVVAISDDGRYVGYVPSGSSNTHVFETTTGKSWQVLVGTEKTWPWSLTFSRDNKQIAYDTNGTTLGVVNLDGTGARTIYQPKKTIYVGPLGWSKSGAEVIALIENDETKKKTIEAIDLKTGQLKLLGAPPAGGYNWRLSTKGDVLATRSGSGLNLFDITSGQERLSVRDDVVDLIGWCRNDSELFYTSNRTGRKSVWALPMKAGQPAGEPRLIKELAEHTRARGVTSDGSICYMEDRLTANVCVAAANFETGEIITAPRRVTDRYPGVQTEPIWSTDGSKLWLAIQGDQRRLLAVTPHTGQLEEFSVVTGLMPNFRQFSWSKDGTFFLLQGQKAQGAMGSLRGPTGILRFEPASGKAEALVRKDSGEWVCYPRLTGDEKAFFFVRRKFGKENSLDWTDRIVRRELSGGRETPVFETSDKVNIWCAFEPSPDDARLAIVVSDQFTRDDFVVALKLLDLRTGQSRELLRLAPRENITSLRWTRDGQRIVYTRETPGKEGQAPDATSLWSMAVDSGQTVKVNLSEPDVSQLALHPDGKQFAFRRGSIGDVVDVWLLQASIPAPGDQAAAAPPAVIGAGQRFSIPVEELLRPDGSLLDPKTGLKATLPPGWVLRSGLRGNLGDASTPVGMYLRITSSEYPDGSLAISQHSIDSLKPMPLAAADAWLRHWQETDFNTMRTRNGVLIDFKYRPDGVTSRTIGGHAAISWSADLTNRGEPWAEYAAIIHSDRGPIFVRLFGPVNEIERFRPAFDRLLESVRVP